MPEDTCMININLLRKNNMDMSTEWKEPVLKYCQETYGIKTFEDITQEMLDSYVEYQENNF